MSQLTYERINSPLNRLCQTAVVPEHFAHYFANVDSRRLSTSQIEHLRTVMLRQSRYLHRLVDRMVKLHWRVDDPVWITTFKAREAVDAMLRELVVRRKPGGRLP